MNHDGSEPAIAFSPDGTRFASGGSDSVVRVRTVETGPSLDLPCQAMVTSVAFSPDGSVIALADFEQVVAHNLSTGAVLWQGPLLPNAPGGSGRGCRFRGRGGRRR